MKTPSVKALYNDIGRQYDENKSRAVSDYTEVPTMLRLAGDVKNQRVLDAGCGPGRHSKKLIAKGARVTGIDISDEMIGIARQHCGPAGDFFTADFERVEFAAASFDLIVASLSLMYSKNLTPVFKRFRQWLTPKGRLIFSIYHPVRFLHKIADFDFSKSRKVWIYLEGCDVTVFNYYHPLEKYFSAQRENGFELLEFIEPVLSRRYKGWPEDYYRIPRSIVIKAQRR